MSIISKQSQVEKSIVTGKMHKITYLKKKPDGGHFVFCHFLYNISFF